MLRRALMGLDQPDEAVATQPRAEATPQEVDELVSKVVPVEEEPFEEGAVDGEAVESAAGAVGVGVAEAAPYDADLDRAEVVDDGRFGDEEDERRTRLKLIWAVIIIVVLR